MTNKKAEIEVQFNWIFVLIIGSLILGFFGTIIYQQKSISETKTTHEILSRLDTVFTASSTSKDKFERVETPDVEFRFTYKPGYIIGSQSQDLKGKLIFAPSYFKGDSFSIWVKSWNLDFDIVNFAYVTNPTVRYYLIEEDQGDAFAHLINASIERRTQKDSSENLVRMDLIKNNNINNIEDKGYQRVRLIYFQADDGSMPSAPPIPDSLKTRKNSEVSALIVVPTISGEDGDLAFGKLYFYKKSGSGENSQFIIDDSDTERKSSFDYVGKELLYGAIFVDKATAYQYLFGKAMDKLEIISRIYEQRSGMIVYGESAADLDYCGDYSSEDFKSLAEAAKTSNIDGPDGMISVVSTLKTRHQDLMDNSCPSLY